MKSNDISVFDRKIVTGKEYDILKMTRRLEVAGWETEPTSAPIGPDDYGDYEQVMWRKKKESLSNTENIKRSIADYLESHQDLKEMNQAAFDLTQTILDLYKNLKDAGYADDDLWE